MTTPIYHVHYYTKQSGNFETNARICGHTNMTYDRNSSGRFGLHRFYVKLNAAIRFDSPSIKYIRFEEDLGIDDGYDLCVKADGFVLMTNAGR